MKQFIVLAAILPLMLVFISQYVLDQKNSAAISTVQEIVYTAKEQAKQEGCFTDGIKSYIRDNISAALEIDGEEVIIDATETRQYRVNYFEPGRERGLIHYSISVPIDRIMAGGNLFGIRDEDNIALYTVEGVTASERLPD